MRRSRKPERFVTYLSDAEEAESGMNKRRAKPVKVRSTPRRFTIARAWIAIVFIAGALVIGLLAMRPGFLAPRSTPPSVETTAANVTSSSASLGFLPTAENTTRPSGPAPDGMVWIPGGEFSMGAQDPTDMHDAVGMQATEIRVRSIASTWTASGWTRPR